MGWAQSYKFIIVGWAHENYILSNLSDKIENRVESTRTEFDWIKEQKLFYDDIFCQRDWREYNFHGFNP